jgi:hypothetical protein
MNTPGDGGQFEFCWLGRVRLPWNWGRSRHEALIAMASRGGFFSRLGSVSVGAAGSTATFGQFALHSLEWIRLRAINSLKSKE